MSTPTQIWCWFNSNFLVQCKFLNWLQTAGDYDAYKAGVFDYTVDQMDDVVAYLQAQPEGDRALNFHAYFAQEDIFALDYTRGRIDPWWTLEAVLYARRKLVEGDCVPDFIWIDNESGEPAPGYGGMQENRAIRQLMRPFAELGTAIVSATFMDFDWNVTTVNGTYVRTPGLVDGRSSLCEGWLQSTDHPPVDTLRIAFIRNLNLALSTISKGMVPTVLVRTRRWGGGDDPPWVGFDNVYFAFLEILHAAGVRSLFCFNAYGVTGDTVTDPTGHDEDDGELRDFMDNLDALYPDPEAFTPEELADDATSITIGTRTWDVDDLFGV